MSAFVPWTAPHFKQASEPRAITRRKRRASDAKQLRDAYADVDRRDMGICWATGRYTSPHAPDPRVRREHHHLKGRRVRPEWVTRPERIITVAAEVHQLITDGWIEVEGCNARKLILFHWNRAFVKPGKEPFALKTRRRMEDAE